MSVVIIGSRTCYDTGACTQGTNVCMHACEQTHACLWRWWHSVTLSHSGVSAVSLTLKPKRCDSNNLHPDKASTYATPRRKTMSPSDSVWGVPNQWNARRRSHHSRHWLKAYSMRACLWEAENATRYPKNASRHLCVCCCSRAAAATVCGH